MTEASIKIRVETLLSKANRDHEKGFNRSLLACVFAILFLPFVAFFTSYLGMGFGIPLSFIIAVVGPIFTLGIIFVLWMSDEGHRAQQIAAEERHERTVFATITLI